MPVRAPSICVCGKVIPSGVTCPCRKQAKAVRDAKHDRKRGTSSQRGYTGAWGKARRDFLLRRPVCAFCGGRADLVDHKTPHRGDKALFWDQANWQPLCTPCHSGAKQRLERRHHEVKS